MRLVPLVLLALALAACGSGAEQTGVPASSGQSASSTEGSGTAEQSGPSSAPADEPDLRPPPLLLVYRGEEQKAVQGSYCVDYVEEATGQGSGACADMGAPIYPEALTSVGVRGERVTFVLRHARFTAPSAVTIRPLGCSDRTVDEITLPAGKGEHEWNVDLESGAYQLDVFTRFAAEDGRTGDLSGTLGLTVAGPKKWDALGVSGIRRSDQVCPFAG